MPLPLIDIGSAPDAGDGDNLRSAFGKVNAFYANYVALTQSLGDTDLAGRLDAISDAIAGKLGKSGDAASLTYGTAPLVDGLSAAITRLYGPDGLGIDIRAYGTLVPSAATIDLGAIATIKAVISGTSTITSFGRIKNAIRLATIQGVLTLTHTSPALILPGGANIVTAPGDTLLATSDSVGNWTVRHYQRASGKALVGPAAAEIGDASASGRGVLTGTPAAGAAALGLGTGNAPTFAGVTSSGPVAANGGLSVTGSASFSGGGTFGGNLQFPNSASSGGINVIHGDGGGSGYLEFLKRGSSIRDAYIGYFDGSSLYYVVTSGNHYIQGPVVVTSPVRFANYTVGTLPTAGQPGRSVWASNGRAFNGAGTLEAAGAGTGVLVTDNGAAWKIAGTNQTVQA